MNPVHASRLRTAWQSTDGVATVICRGKSIQNKAYNFHFTILYHLVPKLVPRLLWDTAFLIKIDPITLSSTNNVFRPSSLPNGVQTNRRIQEGIL
jgi:hypothetical protein